MILLSQPSKRGDYRCVPPRLLSNFYYLSVSASLGGHPGIPQSRAENQLCPKLAGVATTETKAHLESHLPRMTPKALTLSWYLLCLAGPSSGHAQRNAASDSPGPGQLIAHQGQPHLSLLLSPMMWFSSLSLSPSVSQGLWAGSKTVREDTPSVSGDSISLRFVFIFNYVCLCKRGPVLMIRVSDSLELGLWAVVSHRT